eukprot:4270573-Amphidinium_carterae.1
MFRARAHSQRLSCEEGRCCKEMMTTEQLAKLADAMVLRSFEPGEERDAEFLSNTSPQPNGLTHKAWSPKCLDHLFMQSGLSNWH